jgi:hypothetical protein
VTPVVFSLRSGDTSPGLDLTVDITRISLMCSGADAVDLIKFGSIAALTNGIVLQRTDGDYRHIFNSKSNFNLAGSGEFSLFSATNPAHGLNGFRWNLGIAGQNNLGVAIRLAAGEDLQLIIQDDLTGLTELRMFAFGHVTDEVQE